MTDQQPLFPVDQTTEQRCPLCKATRPAGQPRTTHCQYELDGRDGRRPAACLNTIDPRYTELPF